MIPLEAVTATGYTETEEKKTQSPKENQLKGEDKEHLLLLQGRFNKLWPWQKKAFFGSHNDHGETYLHRAVELNHESTVKWLLEVKADPCVKDKLGFQPIHVAALKGNIALAMQLMAKNPLFNLNCQTLTGETPLSLAVFKGKVVFINRILYHFADPCIIVRGQSLLHIAVIEQRYLSLQALMRCNDLKADILNDEKETALHVAASKGYTAYVRLLLGKDPDINRRGPHGTPLQRALENGHKDVVNLLVWKGAIIERADQDKVEALLAPPPLASSARENCLNERAKRKL